jgi:hypothetical protein
MLERANNERGVALVVSIFAMVVIGALVAAAFFVGMQEQRVGRNTIRLQQALAAAEEGVARRIAVWNPAVSNRIAVGSKLAFSDTVSNGGGWYRGEVLRIDSMMFLVSAEGFSPDSSARQRVGMLARLRPVELTILASLETQGAVDANGTITITGENGNPDDWGPSGQGLCSQPTDTLPGVRTPEADSVSQQGNTDVSGLPDVEEDASINDSTLTWFGDTPFDELQSLATLYLPSGGSYQNVQPALSGTVCNYADDHNWGEPNYSGVGPNAPVAVCQDYYPVVFSNGDLTVNGNRGQGLLIVRGDLNIQGGFEWAGPILVKGTVSFAGTGNKVMGGVIAANVVTADDASSLSGTADLFYSSCAIERATAFGATAWPLRERAWVNLY